MKSATTVSAVVEIVPLQRAVGLGLEREHRVPRLDPGQRGRTTPPRASHEEVRQRRVVGPAAAVADDLERLVGREEPAVRLHVVAEVHDAHRQGDLLAARVVGVAGAVPALEGEAQGVPHVRVEAEPLGEHVADLAARGEVVDRPGLGALVDHLDDLLALLGRPARGGERDHVADHLGRVARRRGPASARGSRSRRRRAWRPRARGRCSRCSAAARPSRPCRASRRSNPASSLIHTASRQDRSCDSSGCPNALSWASARVATSSPIRSGGDDDDMGTHLRVGLHHTRRPTRPGAGWGVRPMRAIAAAADAARTSRRPAARRTTRSRR